MREKTKEPEKKNIVRISKNERKELKGQTNWAYLFSKERKEGYKK